MHNYWTPLASQVEELDNPPPPMNHLLSIRQTPPCRQVTFALTPHHVNKDSTTWWRRRPPNKRTTYRIDPLAAQHNMRMGVLNGTIPSAVSDTGATSSAFPQGRPIHSNWVCILYGIPPPKRRCCPGNHSQQIAPQCSLTCPECQHCPFTG